MPIVKIKCFSADHKYQFDRYAKVPEGWLWHDMRDKFNSLHYAGGISDIVYVDEDDPNIPKNLPWINRNSVQVNLNQLRTEIMSEQKSTLDKLTDELKQLKVHFDPTYEYSDDFTVWSTQRALDQKIRAKEREIADLK